MRRQRGVFLLGECPGKGQTIALYDDLYITPNMAKAPFTPVRK